MTARTDTPTFGAPPVVETVIGVKFTPIEGFRSQHYGLFWHDYLKPLGWEPVADEKPLPEYTEAFDSVKLKLEAGKATSGIRMKLKSSDRVKTLQVQPDKLYFSWGRDGQEAPDYSKARPEFDSLYETLTRFVQAANLGPLEPNLWETAYINRVPAGPLWTEPKDWHRVLPKLFPSEGPSCEGVRFTTYDGTWHFEIEPKRGRVHVRVAKMVVNHAPEPVLFIMLTARGATDEEVGWSDGLELGHASCVRLFLELTSEEAKRQWGHRS
jgi:uncharacterized protein (TIGR04255 family)